MQTTEAALRGRIIPGLRTRGIVVRSQVDGYGGRGVSDLECNADGVPCYLELKAADGKLMKIQRLFLADRAKEGAIAVEVRAGHDFDKYAFVLPNGAMSVYYPILTHGWLQAIVKKFKAS
jgi:hypothetical protein